MALKSNFKLSSLQRSVLVGTILGDGGIQLKGNDARLHIKHAASQLALVEYKRLIFDNISTMNVRAFSQYVGKSNYKFAEFVTLTHPVFLEYYRLFYPIHKKTVPKNIIQLLCDPLSLAVWIMDDGSAEYAGLSIQTHSFEEAEVDLLRNAVENNFGIKTGRRLNKGKWIMYFPKSSMPRLRELVGNLVLKEFTYKLVPYSLKTNPVETARRTPTKCRDMIQSDLHSNMQSLAEMPSRPANSRVSIPNLGRK